MYRSEYECTRTSSTSAKKEEQDAVQCPQTLRLKLQSHDLQALGPKPISPPRFGASTVLHLVDLSESEGRSLISAAEETEALTAI